MVRVFKALGEFIKEGVLHFGYILVYLIFGGKERGVGFSFYPGTSVQLRSVFLDCDYCCVVFQLVAPVLPISSVYSATNY